MVILLGETTVILLALPLELLQAPKRLVGAEVKVIPGLAGEEEEEEGDCCCCWCWVEEGGRCGLVCVPVEAFEAVGNFVGLPPPSCLILDTEGEAPFVCGNPAEAFAGECPPFIC